jgi:hypothetical protein
MEHTRSMVRSQSVYYAQASSVLLQMRVVVVTIGRAWCQRRGQADKDEMGNIEKLDAELGGQRKESQGVDGTARIWRVNITFGTSERVRNTRDGTRT